VNGLIISLVRFKSKLDDDDVRAMFEERSDRYRSVPGLVEKLYLRFRDTGEFGAVYVWDSEDALARFRESDLARTIPSAYQVVGAPSFEIGDVRLVVQPDRMTVPG
jgi:heme-degrading monooxygenase HmoA